MRGRCTILVYSAETEGGNTKDAKWGNGCDMFQPSQNRILKF